MAIKGPSAAYLLKANPGLVTLPLTMSVFVNVPVSAPAGTNHVLKLYQASNNGVSTVHYVPGGGDPNNYGGGADCALWNGTLDASAIGNVVTAGQWIHLCGTYDDQGTGLLKVIKFYCNGILNNTVSGSISGADATPADFTGQIAPSDSNGGASIAFPAMWQRVLVQSEVTSLAAGADPRLIQASSLKSLLFLLGGDPTSQKDEMSAVPWTGPGGLIFVANPPMQFNPSPPIPVPPPTTMSPPFMPPKFAPGPPTVPVWEDGPGQFLNPSNSGTPVNYTGQTQSALIVNAKPKPPRQTHPSTAGSDSKIK